MRAKARALEELRELKGNEYSALGKQMEWNLKVTSVVNIGAMSSTLEGMFRRYSTITLSAYVRGIDETEDGRGERITMIEREIRQGHAGTNVPDERQD